MIGEILVKIGSITIYTYGFFVMIAVLVSAFFIHLLSKKYQLNKTIIFDLIIYTLLFGIIGARILYFFLYREQFQGASDIIRIWQGGLVSWGGFITGVTAAIIVIKIYRGHLWQWLDIIFISTLSGLAIGRLGSFLSGELAGTSYRGFLSVSGQHPVTLYESLFLSILFFLSLVIYFKYYRTIRPGFFSLEVLSFYALGRFLIDFFRQEQDIILNISLGQIFSAIVFVVSIVLLITIIITNRKGPKNAFS